MMKKKKLLCTLLAVVVIASLCACIAFSAQALDIIDGFEGGIER